MNIDFRRCSSIFCLFAGYKDGAADHSALKIEKYNAVLNRLEVAAEITLGARIYFRVIMQKNRIYILGGLVNGVTVKSVSTMIYKIKIEMS